MQHQEYNKEPLQRYLLGDLDEDARIEIEARLLLDNDYNDQLLIVQDELIDDFICGGLPPPERDNFEKLTRHMPDLLDKIRIREAIESFVTPSPQSGSRPVMGLESKRSLFDLNSFLRQIHWQPIAALAILAIALSAGAYWFLIYRSEFRKGMLALNDAFSQERPLEPRISALNHAPYSVRRGPETPLTGPDKLRLDRAGRIFLDLVSEKPGPVSFHAAGRYYLTQKDYVQAIDQFNSALKADAEKPRLDHEEKAQVQNDYAVALMEKAKGEKEKDPVKYELGMAESREHLHEALKLHGESPEAQFNLGLWLQERRLWKQAEEAWNKYLERDSSSAWAEEARKYREIAIEEGKKQVSLTPPELLRDFLNAYHANDKAKAWRILSQNREPITERLVWWQLAGAFLNAAMEDRRDQADDLLRALTYAGELEIEKGDHFTSQLANFYHSVDFRQHQTLIHARELTRQGHALCLKSKYAAALENYRTAQKLFELAEDKWEHNFVGYWIGYCYLQTSQPKQSLFLLQRLSEDCLRQKHLSLLVQTFNSLGSAHFAFTEYSKSNKLTHQALNVAEQIGDIYGMQKSLAQLANQHKVLDDFPQSLAYLSRCRESADRSWPSDRQMWRMYDTLAQVFYAMRFYASAADCQKEALRLAVKEFHDPAHVSVSYTQLSSIYGKLNNHDEAIKLAQSGLETGKSAGRRMLGYALLRLGHLYRESGDINLAIANYNQSIKHFADLNDQVLIYNAYKGRLLCYLSQNNDASAKEDLQKVLDLAEKYRTKIIEEKHRNTFFDVEQSVYDIAINFAYSRMRDHQASFNFSEASRARSLLDLTISISDKDGLAIAQPLKLEQIQNGLPRQSQILQYALLEDKLLIWVISQNHFETVEVKTSPMEIQEKLAGYWSRVTRPSMSQKGEAELLLPAKALYEILIAPLEARGLLDRRKTICVVPDKVLNYLPFNALASSTDQYLINDYRFTFAPSSTIYIRCYERARQRGVKTDELLLSLGNPSFNRDAFPLEELPGSEREAGNVAKYYRRPFLLTGSNAREASVKNNLDKFDVLHLASHYVVDERSPLLSKLLLAQEPFESSRGDGVLQAEEVYRKKPLRARLVVLSACRSGVERYYNGEGMIGMARTFIASGVPLVVASLWPVDSEATSELMVNFHRYRKQAGLPTAEALRRAQSDMSNSSSQRYHHPYYWASFIVIGGYAEY